MASYLFSFSIQRERERSSMAESSWVWWASREMRGWSLISPYPERRHLENIFFPTYLLPYVLTLRRVRLHVRNDPSVCCFSSFFLFLFFWSAPNVYLDIAGPSGTQTKWRLNEYWVSPPQSPVNLERFLFIFSFLFFSKFTMDPKRQVIMNLIMKHSLPARMTGCKS